MMARCVWGSLDVVALDGAGVPDKHTEHLGNDRSGRWLGSTSSHLLLLFPLISPSGSSKLRSSGCYYYGF